VTLPVVWLPEADAELKEALARYEGVRPELAQRFVEAASGYCRGNRRRPYASCGEWKTDGGGPEYVGSLTGSSSS